VTSVPRPVALTRAARVLLPAVLAVVALGLSLLSCGAGGDGRDDDAGLSLCTSADDYLWFDRQLAGGADQDSPTGARARTDVSALLGALDDLLASVPADLRDEVRYTRRMWSDLDRLERRYDYGAGPRQMSQREAGRLMARYTPSTPALRLTRSLEKRCAGQRSPSPTPPHTGTG
jgi:hypothetical protein